VIVRHGGTVKERFNGLLGGGGLAGGSGAGLEGCCEACLSVLAKNVHKEEYIPRDRPPCSMRC